MPIPNTTLRSTATPATMPVSTIACTAVGSAITMTVESAALGLQLYQTEVDHLRLAAFSSAATALVFALPSLLIGLVSSSHVRESGGRLKGRGAAIPGQKNGALARRRFLVRRRMAYFFFSSFFISPPFISSFFISPPSPRRSSSSSGRCARCAASRAATTGSAGLPRASAVPSPDSA